MFCKRATMLYSTERRLACLVSWLPGLEQLACGGLQAPWEEMCRRAGLAASLHTLSLGWDETEYVGILELLEQRYPVLRRLGSLPGYFMAGDHQNIQDQEHRQLREILRTFFWQFAPDEATQATWLAYILQRFSCHHPFLSRTNFTRHGLQSLLLFFLLGCTEPSAPGVTFQQSFLDRLQITPDYSVLQDQNQLFTQSYSEAKHIFGDIGKALQILESHKPNLDPGTPLPLLMTTLLEGDGWVPDHRAAHLLFTSETTVTCYLQELARDGYEKQPLARVAEILVSMLVVCARLGNRLNQGLVNILDFAFTVIARTDEEKAALIKKFWREIGERVENDLGLDIFVQLGVQIGMRAYMDHESNQVVDQAGPGLMPEE